MASPAFWMLRPKKKKKNLRITSLCISCPFITSIRKFSRCYFQNTSKIQLLPTLPVTALNPAPSSSPQLLPALNHCQPLPAVYSQSSSPGDTSFMSLLCSKPHFPPHSRVKAKIPMVAYWSVPPLNIVLAFSLWLCFSYICLLGIPWICQGNSHFLPLYKLSQWLEWSVPTVCTAISFTPFKPLIK